MYLDRDSAFELFDLEDLVVSAYMYGANTEEGILGYVRQFMNVSAEEVQKVIVELFDEVTVN